MIFPAVAAVLLILSAVANRHKTVAALKVAWNRFWGILPLFLALLAAASFVLAAVPQSIYERYLSSDSPWFGTLAAGVLGSVSILPGFVAFPLAAMLVERGVARVTVSLFTTTLMMVGVLTLPIEMRYLGRRIAILRNVFALLTAMAVALVTGLYFGEIL